MILSLLLVTIIISIYLTKGNLKWIVSYPLKQKWLVPTSLFIQFLIFSEFALNAILPLDIVALLHVSTYILLLLFVVINFKVPGILLIGLGTLSNAMAIIFNGGFMPNKLFPPGVIFSNVIGISPNSRLLFLSDVLYLPEWLGLPPAFSIGDILLILGLFVYLVINSREPKSTVIS